EVFRGNLNRRARLAHRIEVGAGRQPRAGAVAVPFMEDEPRSRHEIEHRGHDVAVETRRRSLTVFRETPVGLWPEPGDDERIEPLSAFRRGYASAALHPGLAVGWRPRQRQNVEIKLTRGVLPCILRGGAHHERSKKR